MNKFQSMNKPLMWSMTILMTAIMAGCGGTTGAVGPAGAAGASGASPLATALGTTASPSIAISAASGVKGTAYSIVPTTPSITLSGIHALMVAPVLTGSGFINVVNNANAHVAATQTGTGTLSVVNNGGVMAATNTGNGKMTINSTDTAGAVTVTNTGDGDITVYATPSDSVLTLT